MAETYSRGVMKPGGEPLFMFDTDNAEFARGFEAGALFTQLAANPGGFEAEIEDANNAMLVRMADALDRAYVTEQGINDSMVKVRVMPKRRPAPSPRDEEEAHD